jgi:hypothetical protein
MERQQALNAIEAMLARVTWPIATRRFNTSSQMRADAALSGDRITPCRPVPRLQG